MKGLRIGALLTACGGSLAPELDAGFDASKPDVSGDTNVDVGIDGGVFDADAHVADAGGIVLASKQLAPFAIVVDGANVYWTNLYAGNLGGWLMKCAVGGCNDDPVTLSTGLWSQTGLAMSGSTLYSAGYGVNACSTGGCGNQATLLSSWQPAYQIASDGTTIWWTLAEGVWSCGVGGCDASAMFTSQGAYGIAIDATDVYWADTISFGSVFKGPKGGGTPSVVISGQFGPFAVAVDDVNVYWTNAGDETNGEIMQCAKDCTTPIVLAVSQYQPWAIASDGTNVYWTTAGGSHANSGTIMRCAVGGCNDAPTALAVGQAYPCGIAVDATNVYWTNMEDGTVMKLPK